MRAGMPSGWDDSSAASAVSAPECPYTFSSSFKTTASARNSTHAGGEKEQGKTHVPEPLEPLPRADVPLPAAHADARLDARSARKHDAGDASAGRPPQKASPSPKIGTGRRVNERDGKQHKRMTRGPRAHSMMYACTAAAVALFTPFSPIGITIFACAAVAARREESATHRNRPQSSLGATFVPSIGKINPAPVRARFDDAAHLAPAICAPKVFAGWCREGPLFL
ncbi:hypothetical protein FB451DRAFT_1388154 [Mycena latifolia]|nr:hypothetical protein FB451DRAFT_1388154 [Mycena latifolia]